MSLSRHPEIGDQIVANDTRVFENSGTERVGVVRYVEIADEVEVHWRTSNRVTLVKLVRIHDDKKPRRAGYTLLRKAP